MTPSKALFCLCCSFISGISLQSIFKTPQAIAWGVFVMAVILMLIGSLFKGKVLVIAGFCLVFFVLGAGRTQLSELKREEDLLSRLNDRGEKIAIIGHVAREPEIYPSHQNIRLKTEQITVSSGTKDMQGLVLVTLDRRTEFMYLDRLRLFGELKSPESFEDFDYRGYLAKDGIYSTMAFPKADIISKDHSYALFSYAYEKVLLFKDRLRISIYKNITSPENQILEGIVLGTSKGINKDLKEKINAAGLSHVIAVSGTHIVILSSLLMSLLLLSGFWRQHACYFSLFLIWFYIVLIGFPPSGVRAAIMGTFFLLAQALGRQNVSSRTIILAAALMLFHNPLILRHDVGFQLSFLASLGIIHGKPIIDDSVWFLRQNRFAKHFTDMISVTLIAQVFTLPVIIYHFGKLSLVAPLANLFILPVVYWLMVFGFLASFLGIFSSAIGFIFAVPAWFLLFYFVKVLDVLYQPWASASIDSFSWIWIAVYYLVLAAAIWYLQKWKQPMFLRY